MSSSTFRVDFGASHTTALRYLAPSDPAGRRSTEARPTLVLAPGAGAPHTHPWMVRMAQALASRGLDVVTFNFLYGEAKRRAPDRSSLLEATWRAVLDAVRARPETSPGPIFIGGKSMGGRIATHVAAAGGVDVAGLVLLGYPLHPPGRPGTLRAAHLPKISAPMLFVQGSRDTFGTPEELGPIVDGLSAGSRLWVIPGGDHSFAVPKGDHAAGDVVARVADEVARFVRGQPTDEPGAVKE